MQSKSDDNVVLTHSLSPSLLTCTGMCMEELEIYINHLEMLRDEQCDQLRDTHQTHAQELEIEHDHIEEL